MAHNDEGQQSFPVIDLRMAIKAMRDSGYKSTPHALAELIDNSIEANATHIELFGLSKLVMVEKRRSVRLKELAVLDNGDGMDSDTLRGSLRYGIGTRQERKGIGRFGMGLPNSSISQARRVEVWSWQDGIASALYTCLSIDDVENGMEEIPEPELKPIPARYSNNSLHGIQEKGTLVLWKDLDRVDWSGAATVFKKTEYFVGRIYRRFLVDPSSISPPFDNLHEGTASRRYITMIALQQEQDHDEAIARQEIVHVRPNDPLYLMLETSCPEDYGEGPMFQELEGSPALVTIPYQGAKHEVRVRASYARPHVRNPEDEEASWPEDVKGWEPGSTVWGKHANGNKGVSVVRAHREIGLDLSWVSGDDPRERWWTVEVDVPTALDEVFGVTHDKQAVIHFQRLAHFDWKAAALEGEKEEDVITRLKADGERIALMWDLRDTIKEMIKKMRKPIRKVDDDPLEDEKAKADAKATAAIKRRIQQKKLGDSDVRKLISSETGVQEQIQLLVRKYNYGEEEATVEVTESEGSKVRWLISSFPEPFFFEVDILPGVVQVVLNDEHPVFAYLYNLMDDVNRLSKRELQERLAKATAAFHILLYSWARYEDEQIYKDNPAVQQARIEWGEYAKEFLEEDDGNPGPLIL